MLREAFHSDASPDDFANRIGPLIGVRRAVVESLFGPNAPTDAAKRRRDRPPARSLTPLARSNARGRTAEWSPSLILLR
jgi:hypothetical protein